MNANLEKLNDLRERKGKIMQIGGDERIAAQHKLGKLTVREGIEKLLDPDSFNELDALAKHRCIQFGMAGKEIPADAVVNGYGTVKGRTVFVGGEELLDYLLSNNRENPRRAKILCWCPVVHVQQTHRG